MITKGNLEKLQNEVITQILTDDTAKRLKFTRLLPKKKLDNDSEYYTYFNQAVTLDEAIAKGELGEVKPIAPGVSLQELNVRTPINKTVAINTFGGVVNIANNLFDKDIYSIINILKDVSALIGTGIEKTAVSTIMNSSDVNTYNTTETTYADYEEFISNT